MLTRHINLDVHQAIHGKQVAINFAFAEPIRKFGARAALFGKSG
jgi:hypothetical protein